MQLNSYQQSGIVVHIPMLVGDVIAGELWTNMPAALTETQSAVGSMMEEPVKNTTTRGAMKLSSPIIKDIKLLLWRWFD